MRHVACAPENSRRASCIVSPLCDLSHLMGAVGCRLGLKTLILHVWHPIPWDAFPFKRGDVPSWTASLQGNERVFERFLSWSHGIVFIELAFLYWTRILLLIEHRSSAVAKPISDELLSIFFAQER